MTKINNSPRAEVYLEHALDQIPRLLSMVDRNEYSPTFGCADRTYWLDKAIDFPSSILQYGVHSLAIVYAHKLENNPYYQQPKIRKWAEAMMNYWVTIQKNDGSFDEFYPNERGWAGPTGFLLYAMLGAYELLKDELSPAFKTKFFSACRKAADYLAKYDEHGVLANHHAMALLPIYHYFHVTGDREPLYNFEAKLNEFLGFQSKEGWFLEYDGADLGYLSASISFMTKVSKLMQHHPEHAAWKKKVDACMDSAIEFASYFVYPNGYYGGTMGSRQTLHFYPHGIEVHAAHNALAARMAEHMRFGVATGALVTPKIMPERYLGYRLNEYLVTYLDAPQKFPKKELLPWEKKPFHTYFPLARIAVYNEKNYYAVLNLAKGGVLKVFDKKTNQLTINDCGLRMQDEKGAVFSTQWIDEQYVFDVDSKHARVNGELHRVHVELPTPSKMMALRAALITLGSDTDLAYKIKGKIRERIILKNKRVPIPFSRKITFGEKEIVIEDRVETTKAENPFSRGTLGDEFSIRYVPQSLYFQMQELGVSGYSIPSDKLVHVNQHGELSVERTVSTSTGKVMGVHYHD